MTEPIIKRFACLSDGAMATMREDLAEAKAGEPMVLAWNYVSKALDEIEWLRQRERDLELTISGKTFSDPTDVRVAELVHSLADAMEQIEAIQGSNATHMAANGLPDEDAEAYADKVEPSCPKCERVKTWAVDMLEAATEVSGREMTRLRVELATARAQLTALANSPAVLTDEQDRDLREHVDKLRAEMAEGCLQVGKVYRHPLNNRLMRVTEGTFIGGYERVSNFWNWDYVDDDFSPAGDTGQGYGWKAEPVEEPE